MSSPPAHPTPAARRGRSATGVCLLALTCALLIAGRAPGATPGGADGAARPPANAISLNSTGLEATYLAQTLEQAAALPRLNTLLIARDGVPLVERVFRGPGPDQPVNVKSVSKAVLSAVAGAAIERGLLEGVDQRIVPILDDDVPADADARLEVITIEHLLTMRAGLERTSGRNYGRWVTSPDWVRFALSRPFVDEPGAACSIRPAARTSSPPC